MPGIPEPLRDLQVVEIGSSLAGAYCGKLLAAFGAQVVKVEPPTGDPMRRLGPFVGDRPAAEGSLPFLYLNTSKQSVTLESESGTGHGLLRRLLLGADIVLDSLGPGRLDATGFVPRLPRW